LIAAALRRRAKALARPRVTGRAASARPAIAVIARSRAEDDEISRVIGRSATRVDIGILDEQGVELGLELGCDQGGSLDQCGFATQRIQRQHHAPQRVAARIPAAVHGFASLAGDCSPACRRPISASSCSR
jgi:hypothetical protein